MHSRDLIPVSKRNAATSAHFGKPRRLLKKVERTLSMDAWKPVIQTGQPYRSWGITFAWKTRSGRNKLTSFGKKVTNYSLASVFGYLQSGTQGTSTTCNSRGKNKGPTLSTIPVVAQLCQWDMHCMLSWRRSHYFSDFQPLSSHSTLTRQWNFQSTPSIVFTIVKAHQAVQIP